MTGKWVGVVSEPWNDHMNQKHRVVFSKLHITMWWASLCVVKSQNCSSICSKSHMESMHANCHIHTQTRQWILTSNPEIRPPPSALFITANLKLTTWPSFHEIFAMNWCSNWKIKGQEQSTSGLETELNNDLVVWPWMNAAKPAAVYTAAVYTSYFVSDVLLSTSSRLIPTTTLWSGDHRPHFTNGETQAIV